MENINSSSSVSATLLLRNSDHEASDDRDSHRIMCPDRHVSYSPLHQPLSQPNLLTSQDLISDSKLLPSINSPKACPRRLPITSSGILAISHSPSLLSELSTTAISPKSPPDLTPDSHVVMLSGRTVSDMGRGNRESLVPRAREISSRTSIQDSKITNCRFPEGYARLEEHSSAISTASDSDYSTSAPASLDLPVLCLGILNIFTDTALGSSVVPILPRELGLDQIHEGVILAVGSVTASLFGPVCGWFSDTKGWIYVLSWFYPLVCISSALLMTAKRSFWKFIFARLIAGMASGVMYPSNLSMIVVTHDSSIRATAVGFTLAGDLGSLCGPLLGGMLYDQGGASCLYSVMLCLCIFNSFIFIWVSRRIKLSQQQTPDANMPVEFKVKVSHEVPKSLENANISRNSSGMLIPPGARSAFTPSIRTSSRQPSPATTSDGRMITRLPPLTSQCNHPRRPSFSFCHGSPPPPYLPPSSFLSLAPLRPAIVKRTLTDPTSSADTSPSVLVMTDSFIYNNDGRTDLIENAEITIAETEQESTFSKIKVFLTLDFAVRFFTLFYCWGIALSLQAVLPILWNDSWHLNASTIGVLFSPHLICRVSLSAFSPMFSDITGTPLHELISGGLGLAVAAVFLLALTPLARPYIHSLILSVLGLGLGITDGCVTAWAGGFQDAKGSGVDRPIFHGRAFAVMALACDSGMFLVPLFGSTISQLESFQAAYFILACVGVGALSLSVYCGRKEASDARQETANGITSVAGTI